MYFREVTSLSTNLLRLELKYIEALLKPQLDIFFIIINSLQYLTISMVKSLNCWQINSLNQYHYPPACIITGMHSYDKEQV